MAPLARRLRQTLIDRQTIGLDINDDACRERLASIGSRRPSSAIERLSMPTFVATVASLFATAIGQNGRCVRLWERSVRADPTDSRRWYGLAHALGAAGPAGPVPVTGVGLTLGVTPASSSMDYALERGLQLDPQPAALVDAAESALRQGHIDTALRQAEHAVHMVPTDARSWIISARVMAARSRRAGGLTPDDVTAIRNAWQRARTLDGASRDTARFHQIRHAIRFSDWATAFHAADPSAPQDVSSTSDFHDMIRDRRFIAAADWWYVAWWWLQSSGAASVGWSARRREAERRLENFPASFGSINSIRTASQSLVVLGRTDDALELVRRAARLADRTGVLERLRADLLLRQGDASELVRWTESHRTGLPEEPERQFSQIVQGSRVLILGPNASDADRITAAETSNVVIDTKRLAPTGVPSTATHVSYYADTSAALVDDAIVDLLDSGSLDLAVLRPTAADSPLLRHRRARLMSTEDSLSLGVSHFGIARIVYDVVRYEPRSILLVGVDLFTKPTAYPGWYMRDQQRYVHAGFVPVLPRFNHDLGDDFLMLSALRRLGVIEADHATSRILDLALSDYLDLVDRAPSTFTKDDR